MQTNMKTLTPNEPDFESSTEEVDPLACMEVLPDSFLSQLVGPLVDIFFDFVAPLTIQPPTPLRSYGGRWLCVPMSVIKQNLKHFEDKSRFGF